MKTESTHGIILRRIDYGEADRIITFITDGPGKMRAIAKGVRKQKSKMAGGIELFSVSEIHYIKGRGDIDTLTSTRLIKHYSNIVKDLDRTELAYSMLKKLDKTVEDYTGQEYFGVINESLAALDNNAISQVLVELSFAMRLMQLLGQVPDFSMGSNGLALDPDGEYEFDYDSVAFASKPGGPYDKNHIKVLKLLSHNSPQSMAAVQGVGRYCQDLAGLVRGMLSQYAS